MLALIALFTGAFLAHAALSLGVVQRAPQFALLAVLGLTARQRMGLVLSEALALGLLASTLGVALGTGLAALALRLLGADLGGGYFQNAAPSLLWEPGSALAYLGLGSPHIVTSANISFSIALLFLKLKSRLRMV